MTKQTLIIVSPGFPRDETDTTCMPYIQMFLKALSKSYPELQIKIVSFQYPFIKKTYDWNTCQIIAIGGSNKKLNRLFIWHKAEKEITRIIKTENVIGMLSLWLTECTFVAQKIARHTQTPLVAWSWGQDVKKGNKYIRLLDFNLFKTAVVSPSSRDLLLANYGIKSDLILNNGIEIDSIPAMKNTERDVHILCVGTLNDFKRFDWLVDIMQALNDTNYKAIIIGDGPERKNIMTKIIGAGLQNQITMLGEQKHVDCLQMMNRSKILLHPSDFEGASTVILEALYYGCNVVSVTSPADDMPKTFYKVETKLELINKVKFVLENTGENQPQVVSTSAETAKKLMGLFQI